MEVDNAPLEGNFPLQTVGCPLACHFQGEQMKHHETCLRLQVSG